MTEYPLYDSNEHKHETFNTGF